MLGFLLPTSPHRELMDKVFLATITVMLTIAVVHIIMAGLVFLTGSLGLAIAHDLLGGGSKTGSKTLQYITKKNSAVSSA